MKKAITFCDMDKERIKRIQAYQKRKRLPSFVAAVRELCDSALDISNAVNKL